MSVAVPAVEVREVDELEMPARPYVPRSALAAVGALAVSACLMEVAWRRYLAGARMPVVWALGSAALMAAVLIACLCVHKGKSDVGAGAAAWLCRASWFAGGAVLTSLSCALSLHGIDASQALIGSSTASAYTFIVQGDPSINDRGAAVTAVGLAPDGAEVRVRVNLADPLEPGTSFHAVGTFPKLDDSDFGRARFMRGELATLRARAVSEVVPEAEIGPISWVRTRMLERIAPGESEARALVAGAVCGRTTELGQRSASAAFSVTGLTHLVAVSGGHLALIAALLKGGLTRMGLPGHARRGVLICVMACYVVFTGGAPSAVRSLLMVGAAYLSAGGGRRGHSLSALSLTVVALVTANPGVVYDLGFQLSAASVLFIACFSRYLAYLLQRLRLPRDVAEALALTLCAQWATLPLTVPVFGEVSLISPLANLLVGPVMSTLLVAGVVLVPVATFFSPLSGLIAIPEGVGNLSIWLTELLAGVPYASLAVDWSSIALAALYLFAVICYLLWRDWRPHVMTGVLGVIALCCVGWVVRWTSFAPAAITVLDVGQADAILVRDGGSCMLVDAGVDDEVVAALARQHVMRLDAVVVTHWDADHWGGLPSILDHIPVERIVVARGAATSMPDELRELWEGEVVELEEGDALSCGGFTCEVVWPRVEVAGTENAESLCLEVDYWDDSGRALTALLTGDTEVDQEREYAQDVGDIDFLKVGHHGSKVSVDGDLVRILKPELSVASAGEGNSYGHPSAECVEVLLEGGSEFLCTKDVGDVVVSPQLDGIGVAYG